MSDALDALQSPLPVALQLPFGDSGDVLGELVELDVKAIGVDLYATDLGAAAPVPEDALAGRGREELAGRGAGGFGGVRPPATGRAGGRTALVPNGDLQFVPEKIARQKSPAPRGGGKNPERGTIDDRDPFRDPRDREPCQAWLAREGNSRPPRRGKDVEEAREWGWRLGIDSGELAEILRKGGSFTNEEKVKIQDFAALYGIRILEHAGLDVVYDGEQRRSEMYDHAVRHTKGFETRGTVRSFDNKYYTKAAVVEKPLGEGLRSRRVRVRPVAHGSRRQDPVHWRLHHHGLVLRRALR